MTKIQKWWARMSFWDKVEKSIGVIGGLTITELGLQKADPIWFVVIGSSGVVYKLLQVWLEDKNINGIIDLFEEDEVKP